MPATDQNLRRLGHVIALLALSGLMAYGCQKARTQTAAPSPSPAPQTAAKPAEPAKPVDPPKATDTAAADPATPKPIPHDDLAENAKPLKEFVTPSGLKVEEFKIGEGPFVLPKAFVATHFVLHLKEGWKRMQSTYEDGVPEEHTVDDNLIMSDGLVGMKQGGVRRISVPPERAFADKGVKDKDGNYLIPPGATLVYDVELMSIKQKLVATPPTPPATPAPAKGTEPKKDDSPDLNK